MDESVFMDKARKPTDHDLAAALGATYELWAGLKKFVFAKYPAATEEWSCTGKKYGWSFRLKDRKRAIVYLLPRRGCFKVALVFGAQAVEIIMKSGISAAIRSELAAARPYAEGRGIRIELKDGSVLADIRRLVEIKLAN
ncbi:MAG TPA: DUF3788 domain-containing protein [Acidobacteriota bacterium]